MNENKKSQFVRTAERLKNNRIGEKTTKNVLKKIQESERRIGSRFRFPCSCLPPIRFSQQLGGLSYCSIFIGAGINETFKCLFGE